MVALYNLAIASFRLYFSLINIWSAASHIYIAHIRRPPCYLVLTRPVKSFDATTPISSVSKSREPFHADADRNRGQKSQTGSCSKEEVAHLHDPHLGETGWQIGISHEIQTFSSKRLPPIFIQFDHHPEKIRSRFCFAFAHGYVVYLRFTSYMGFAFCKEILCG